MGKVIDLAVALTLNDRFSKPATGVLSSLGNMCRQFKALNSEIAPIPQKITMMGEAMRSVGKNMMGEALTGFLGLKMAVDALAAPIKTSIEFEANFAGVKKVTEFDRDEGGALTDTGRQQVAELEQGIVDLSLRLPVATNGIMDLVQAAGQAGIARDEMLGFAEDAAKMGVAFGASAEWAGSTMAGWRAEFSMGQDEVRVLADQINLLGNTTNANAPTISEVVSRVGALGEVGGFSASQIAAIGATLTSMKVPAEVASTGINKLISVLTVGAAATPTQSKAFKRLGLDAMEMARLMQDDAATGLLTTLEAIKGLDKVDQLSVIKQLFGEEGMKTIAPLLNQTDYLVEQLNKVGDATKYAGSVQGEYDAQADTTANRIQLMRNSFDALNKVIGDEFLPTLTPMITWITETVQSLTGWMKANPTLVSTIQKVVVGLVALKGAGLAVKFMFGGAISATGSLLRVLTGAPSKLAALAKAAGVAKGGIFKLAGGVKDVAVGVGKFAVSVGSKAIGALADFGASIGRELIQVGKFAVSLAVKAVTAVASFAASLITSAISALASFGSMLVSTVIPAVWSFTVALLANPITWVVLAIVALIAALAALVYYWDDVKAAVVGFVSGAMEWLGSLWNGIVEICGGIFDTITAPFRAAIDTVTGWWDSFWDWLGFGSAEVGVEMTTSNGAAPAEAPAALHAIGGRFSQPHLGWLAEAGPEWYIPEDGSMRSRQLVIGAAAANGMLTRERGREATKTRDERPIVISGPVNVSVPNVSSPEQFVEMLGRGLRRFVDARAEAIA